MYSRTLETISTRKTQLAPTFDAEAIRQLKEAAGQDIMIGGPELAAYGWQPDLSDGEILERLLALNLERAQG